jgi:hypothetical protein
MCPTWCRSAYEHEEVQTPLVSSPEGRNWCEHNLGMIYKLLECAAQTRASTVVTWRSPMPYMGLVRLWACGGVNTSS